MASNSQDGNLARYIETKRSFIWHWAGLIIAHLGGDAGGF